LSGSERWKILSGFDRPVIRQYLKDAIIYGAGFFLQLALPNLIISRFLILLFFRVLGLIRL
jgi:hypothetical protein